MNTKNENETKETGRSSNDHDPQVEVGKKASETRGHDEVAEKRHNGSQHASSSKGGQGSEEDEG